MARTRRLAALLALCACASGPVALAAAGPRASGATPSAPLRIQVGQLIATGFPGTSAPGWLLERLARRELGGVILFGYNVASRPQVTALDRRIQRAAHGDALIALDQEGGQVRRLPWASPLRDGFQQSTAHIAYSSARAAARDLASAGANVNLAPVADVAVGPASEMRRRAFPGSARSVSGLVRSALRGYRGTPVAPTVKHFPGFGAATANTDDAVVRITRTRAQMQATELRPFRAAITAHVPLIMVSHAVYPAYDAAHIASQSRTILQTLLRRRMGFDGVVVTDSMEARAVLARSSVAVAAERSIRAGADIALLSTAGDYQRVFDRLLRTARRDPRFRARVAASYARDMALKQMLRASASRAAAKVRAAPRPRAASTVRAPAARRRPR